jgi:hypothetical protein
MKVRYAVTALLALTTAFTVACDDDETTALAQS